MTEDLIVDFPTTSNRRRSVRFADYSMMYLVRRHDDNKGVDRQDLWYSEEDYSRMRLARQDSVHEVRRLASDGVPIRSMYSGTTGHEKEEEGGSSEECLIGIEHLLTPATIVAVMTCRQRCIRVVLQEQARQRMMNSSGAGILGWDDIAFASIDATRRAKDRARQLGKLHHDSV